jgi:hypothetical protein
MFWDTMASFHVRPTQNLPNGPYRLDQGVPRSFIRATVANLPDNGDLESPTEIKQLSTGIEKITPLGELLEPARTNHVLDSSFNRSFATNNWTETGEGENGSTIDADTADLIFKPTITTQSCKLTAGSPLGATSLRITTDTASLAAGTDFCVSVLHKDSTSGGTLGLRVRRNLDNNFWDESGGGSWSGSTVTNYFTERSEITLDRTLRIPIGVGASAIRVQCVADQVAGQVNNVYHVQLEDDSNRAYPTSPIVTTTATVTRNADDLEVESTDSGRRVWHINRGTLRFSFRPLWLAADFIADEIVRLVELRHDANNHYLISYKPNIPGRVRGRPYRYHKCLYRLRGVLDFGLITGA